MRRLPDVPFVLSCMVAGQGESASGEPVERMLAPLPGRRPAADRLGHELRHRARRAARRGRAGGPR